MTKNNNKSNNSYKNHQVEHMIIMYINMPMLIFIILE